MVCQGSPTRLSPSSVSSSQAAAAALCVLFSSTAYSSRFASTIIIEQVKHVGDVCDVDLEADLRGAVLIFDRLRGGRFGHAAPRQKVQGLTDAQPFAAKTLDLAGYIAIDHHGCPHSTMIPRKHHHDA